MGTTTVLKPNATGQASDQRFQGVSPDLVTYVEQGEEIIKTLQENVKLKGWQTMDAFTSEGFLVKKFHDPVTKRTSFLTQAILDIPCEELFDEVWYNGENTPEWNRNVIKFKFVEIIGDHCRVAYQITAPLAGGMIASRDFLNLLCYKIENNTIYSAYASTSWPGYEATNKYVRAEVYPSGFVYSSVPGDPSKTQIQWLYNTDIRMSFLPDYILNNILPLSFKSYIQYMQEHLAGLRRYPKSTPAPVSQAP
ncbi:unnamed protein product [Darwinula stevensoni]|uniref:START domain-containing protein n=1 Tax=Darwinula stevensoni TaxID=69355 RepID=A0A7R9A4R4_9CRUS|nr:unnamed protein product [Darwinula stevensoni]CAG0883901.1 unnamed protein product [Darwinula stevensoni]